MSVSGRADDWSYLEVPLPVAGCFQVWFFVEFGSSWQDFNLCSALHSPNLFMIAVLIIRLTPTSRPNKVGLKCLSARLSTESFFDFNEIWCVCRGWPKNQWIVMRDGMQYDPIQGRGQGYELLKVGNSAIFKGYLLPHL